MALIFLREIIKLYNGNLNNLKGDYVMATEEIKKIEEDCEEKDEMKRSLLVKLVLS